MAARLDQCFLQCGILSCSSWTWIELQVNTVQHIRLAESLLLWQIYIPDLPSWLS
jgi:hypothetical protein